MLTISSVILPTWYLQDGNLSSIFSKIKYIEDS